MSGSTKVEWELLVDKGKYLEAAELLITSTNNPGSQARKATRETDYFHAGQCYAFAGEDHYKTAISHFVKAHKPSSPEWNLYITATICFLRQDIPAIKRALVQMKEVILVSNKDFELISIVEGLLKQAEAGKYSYKDVFIP